MPERWPRQKNRALLHQHQRINRRDRPARTSEEHHHAARTQQIQPLLERSLAHRVIHHVHAFAPGQPFCLRLKIRLRIKNDVIRSRRPRQRSFFLGRNRRNRPHSKIVRHLDQQQPNSASRGLNQRRLALLQRISVMSQILRRDPLQHGGRSLAFSHARRNLHQPVRWHRRVLGITSEHRGISHTIAHRQVPHVVAQIGPDRRNHARPFLSQDQRQRRLVAPFAVIDVNKVDARRRDLHHGFVRFRLRDRQLHQFHHFRPTRLLYLYGLHLRFSMNSERRKTRCHHPQAWGNMLTRFPK